LATQLKSTVLHAWHLAHGAKMESFGGYDMPLWYASAKNEHLSVLTHAGLFDTSHMAVLLIDGGGAHDLLQPAFTQNLDACIGAGKAPLSAGRCVYGAFLNPGGEVIDDSIVFKLGEDSYMAVVNAGMGPAVVRHLEDLSGRRQIKIRDMSDRMGKIDIQGPLAGKILAKVVMEPSRVFSKLPYFAFKGRFDPAIRAADPVHLKNGTAILLSRTGYTGEFGFEIFMDLNKTVETWELMLEAGRGMDLGACGLAARDSLRTGAVLPLSHQDIGAWPFCNHPWPFALPYTSDRSGFAKTFIGDQALPECAGGEVTLPFVGFDPRKVSTADSAVVLDGAGRPIGKVLTCVTDMGIDRADGHIVSIASPDRPVGFVPKGLCCGFVKVASRPAVHDRVQLRDGRRFVEVEIVDDIRPHRTARLPIDRLL